MAFHSQETTFNQTVRHKPTAEKWWGKETLKTVSVLDENSLLMPIP